MGRIPNSGLFLVGRNDRNAMEVNPRSKQTQEFQEQEEDRGYEQEVLQNKMLFTCLTIKRLAIGEFKEDEEEEGLTTPTRSNQRIPSIPRKCPAAPGKPKCGMKRKKASSPSIPIGDVSMGALESLFFDFGGEIKFKKVKQNPCD